MSTPAPRILLLTGVAGAGKTTIGRRAADVLRWPYFEADDFHPPANRAKMAAGTPLDDADRAPWLASIRARMDEVRATGGSAVFTCSALKQRYRDVLTAGCADVVLVFLTADRETIRDRVRRRQDHFMRADLVDSQFEALEPPTDAVVIDVRLEPDEVLRRVLAATGR